jgi:hypothetical protein
VHWVLGATSTAVVVNTALALVVMAAITWPELLVQQHPAFEWLRVEVVIPTHASSHPVVRTDMYPGLCCSVLCSGLSCVQASSSLVSNTIRGAAVATTTATEAAGPWRATAAVHLINSPCNGDGIIMCGGNSKNSIYAQPPTSPYTTEAN